MSTDSPLVDEVRARAMAISARYGHDLRRYAEHLAEVQNQHRDRVVEQARIGGESGPEERGGNPRPAA